MLEFRAAVEARDLARMRAALHPDVSFRSPVVFKPYEGRDTVMHLLSTVLEVLEDFEYTDELAAEHTHGLVFRARVGDKRVEGWDYLRVDGDGLVTELVVMIRPMTGLVAVAEEMGARLGVSPGGA